MLAAQPCKPTPANKIAKAPLAKCICNNNNKTIGTSGYNNKECVCGFYTSKDISNEKTLAPKSKATTSTKTHKTATVFCSCKKSHCLKKYCACFAAGK